MNNRILTKEERTAINNAMPSEAKYGEVFLAIAVEQAKLTRSETAEAIFKRIEPYLPAHMFVYERVDFEYKNVHARDCPRCKLDAIKAEFIGAPK